MNNDDYNIAQSILRNTAYFDDMLNSNTYYTIIFHSMNSITNVTSERTVPYFFIFGKHKMRLQVHHINSIYESILTFIEFQL